MKKAQAVAMQQGIMHIAGHICEGQTLDARGHDVRVTVIKGGKSANGYYYNEQALQHIARMVDGARAYADHGRSEADQQTRSVRDMVGFYKDAQHVPPGVGSEHGRVDATLHVLEAAAWLWSIIQEAVALDKPDLIGLSIDIFGNWQPSEERQAKQVTRVLSLNSCDIVTRPSAGGSFQRIIHHDTQGEPHMMTSDSLEQASEEQTPGGNVPALAPPSPAILPNSDAQESGTSEQGRMLEAQQGAIQAALAEIAREKCALRLERRLMESQLPEAAQQHLRQQFGGRIFENAELETSMSNLRSMLAGLHASGIITGNGYEKPATGQMISEAEKIQAAFDGMFDLDIDTSRLGNVRAFSSIREAYARVTGDASVAGFSDRSTLGQIRVSEHAPLMRTTEADTTTASFSYLLGTSMNKRLLKDYQAWPAEWQRFVTISPIKDFKQQTRVRLGAFGSLSTVAEDTAYTTISLTDTAATYVPTKRGNLVTVSRETIVNDDLFAIKQIPTKLAVAAAYTLAEFVYAFLSANPNIYDGNALFTSGAPHSNLGSAALSTAAMQSGVTAMREQTNFAGKRLGLRPSFLIVPPELEFVAMVVTKSAGVPGSVNNDINPMLGYVTPIVSPQLSNTSQWFFAADPKVIDTIEVGFVGGQVNPALLIQDQPLWGLSFTQDVVSFKCRHEYGGGVLDYRGLYRGV